MGKNIRFPRTDMSFFTFVCKQCRNRFAEISQTFWASGTSCPEQLQDLCWCLQCPYLYQDQLCSLDNCTLRSKQLAGWINKLTSWINKLIGQMNKVTGLINTVTGRVNTETGRIYKFSGRINKLTSWINNLAERSNKFAGRINKLASRINKLI